jgi:hypothetical protein
MQESIMRVFTEPTRNHDTVRESQSRPTIREERDDQFVRESAKDGAKIGFRVGSAVTLVGILLTQTLVQAEGRGRKARTARKRVKLWAVLGFPGVIVGGVGGAIGAAIGAAAAKVSLAFRKNR